MGDEAEVWKGFGCTKPHFLRKQRGKNTPGERAVLLCAPAWEEGLRSNSHGAAPGVQVPTNLCQTFRVCHRPRVLGDGLQGQQSARGASGISILGAYHIFPPSS